MGTPFKDVIDRSMTMIQDWRIDDLYASSSTNFYSYMSGFLFNAIDDFDGVLDDLTYTSSTDVTTQTVTYSFDNTLTSKEIRILAIGTVLSWMENNLNDIRQMNLHLNIKDFKSFSEANNLKMKQEQYDRLREDFKREITEYQLNSPKFNTIPYFKDLYE